MSSDARGTSYFQKTYASISGDVDLIAEGGTGQPCRWIRVAGAGDLVLELPVDGSPSVTIPGMIVGVVGYAIGNYLGVAIAYILK